MNHDEILYRSTKISIELIEKMYRQYISNKSALGRDPGVWILRDVYLFEGKYKSYTEYAQVFKNDLIKFKTRIDNSNISFPDILHEDYIFTEEKCLYDRIYPSCFKKHISGWVYYFSEQFQEQFKIKMFLNEK